MSQGSRHLGLHPHPSRVARTLDSPAPAGLFGAKINPPDQLEGSGNAPEVISGFAPVSGPSNFSRITSTCHDWNPFRPSSSIMFKLGLACVVVASVSATTQLTDENFDEVVFSGKSGFVKFLAPCGSAAFLETLRPISYVEFTWVRRDGRSRS